MKFSHFFILLALLAGSACQPLTPPATATSATRPTSAPVPTPSPQLGPVDFPDGWALIFSDDFNSPSLDKSKWTTCYWWDKDGCTILTNNELEWYQPENVSIVGGRLVLQAVQRSVTGYEGKIFPYTSGMVSTGRNTSDLSKSPGFVFQYGYVEIKAKIPRGKGLWPAFWLLPARQESLPEIDVMEILGDNPQEIKMNYHYVDASGQETKAGQSWSGPDFSQDWHTFGLDWEPEYLVWYIDGVARFKFDQPQFIAGEPMYIIMNLAVGGDWPGSPDASTVFPSNYEIEYIKVYQRASSSLPSSAIAMQSAGMRK